MTKDEALDLALEFFETMQRYKGVRSKIFIKFEPTATGDYVDLREFDEKAKPIITAIKQARSAPVQEPVVWVRTNGLNNSGVAHYGPTRPPGWVGAATAYFKAPPPEPAQKRMHPELKKLYEDFFDKCFKETVDLALYPTPPAAQPAPVQEPVAWRTFDGEGGYDYRTYDMNEGYAKEWNERNPNHKGWVEPLYTTPPTAQRQWVGLTDAEVMQTMSGDWTSQFYFARAIEAKLKKENT